MKSPFCLYLIYLIVHIASSDPINNTNTTSSTAQPSTQPTIVTTLPPATPANKLATDCQLSKSSQHENKLLDILNKFKGEKYSFDDGEHQYYFTICAKSEKGGQTNEGFVQMNKKSNQTFVLGRLDDVDLEGASSFIRINYKNGDKYNRACAHSERNAVVYIVCDQNKVNPEFRMIEENNERDAGGCEYIFELLTPKICGLLNITTQPTQNNTNTTAAPSSNTGSKLGVVSIILIVVTSLLGVYFIVGTLYMRFVKRATGWDQIPNFGFWSTIGDGSADLCNFLCRCGNRTTEIHTYENINDRMSDDENLLNM